MTEVSMADADALEPPSGASVVRSARRRPLSWAALVPWLFPACLLTLWWQAAARGWVASQILPAPKQVFATLLEHARSGELVVNVGISLGRVAGGFALGSAGGLALGALLGLSRRARDYVEPSFKAVSQVPALGWLPLAMMVLGIGESLKIVLIAQASSIPIALNTAKGIRAVPREYLEVARSFEFTRGQLLRKVVLPGAIPAIFVGIRYGLTQAWLSLVTVELLASSEGLGFLIVWGRQLFQLDLVLAAILVVGVVGLLLDLGLARLEARLLRWRPDAFGAPATGVAP
jgi:sulfonate transport system permease protein